MATKKTIRKKEREKRRRLFEQGLRKTPEIKKDNYYLADKNNHLTLVDAGEVKIDGVTYSTTKKLYQQLLDENKYLNEYLDACNLLLTGVLIEKGYNTPNVYLDALISDISKLKIIEPNKQYEGFKLENGFVKDYGYDVILEVKEKPEDWNKGYYTIKDNKWVLDTDKMNELWGGVL